MGTELITKCMEKGNSTGRMGEATKESMKRIKSMVMEFLLGRMVEATEGSGQMGSSTEKGIIREVTEWRGTGSGSMGKGRVGLMERRKIRKISLVKM
jgi:hypothetical protein